MRASRRQLKVHSDASAALGIVRRSGLGKVRHLHVQELWVQELWVRELWVEELRVQEPWVQELLVQQE